MSEKCLKCFRPLETCYCRYITPVETGVKFVFLMHPKEAYKQRTGTGRLAHLSLPDSEIIIGINFNGNTRLQSLLADPQYFCCVLYPGEDAWCVSDDGVKSCGRQHLSSVLASGKKLLVIVVDATWPCAKKMVKVSTCLHGLQKISFSAGYRSEFTFKREPQPDYISTIESCYYLIKEMQSAGLCLTGAAAHNPKPLMNVFRRMVAYQLDSQKEREASGVPDRYANSTRLRARKERARLAALQRLSEGGAAPETAGQG